MYNKLALSDFLKLFYQSSDWYNWNLIWIINKYLKFQTQYVHFKMRINELTLINKTDDGVKCYLHKQFQLKKCQPSLIWIHLCYSYR